MQCHTRVIARNLCDHLRFRANPVVATSVPAFSNIQNRRCLHISLPSPSDDSPVATSSSFRVADTPLKIASASGSTPPPEEPEEPGEKDSHQQEDVSPVQSWPVSADSFVRPTSRARGRPRGSSSRRGLKSHRPRKSSIYKPNIPEWFISRNVTLCSNLPRLNFGHAESDSPDVGVSSLEGPTDLNSQAHTRFSVSPFIRKELEAHLSAALLVQTGNITDNFSARKTHVHLLCQKRGTIYFLDELIENAAKELEADIVRLDGQDLDELLEAIIDPASSEMGFGPHIFFANIIRDHVKDVGKDMEQREEAVMEEENEEIEEDDERTEETSEFRLPPDMPLRLFRLFAPRPMYPPMVHSSSSTFPSPSITHSQKEDADTKVSTYLDLLVSAPTEKRKTVMKKLLWNDETSVKPPVCARSPRTLIYLRDFQSILDSPRGQIAHQALLNVIHNRRRLGEKVVLVVSDDLPGDNGASAAFSQYYHVINVPPPSSEADGLAIKQDRKARMREINIRSIQSAIRQRSRVPSMEFECPVGLHLDESATAAIQGLGEGIWEANKVQRVASIAMGNHGRWLAQNTSQQPRPITIADIAQAVEDVLKADNERAESKQETKSAREIVDQSETERDTQNESVKLPPINSKDYNKHEQRLLGGVIDPDKINVRFSDIRAPESTIQALKVLVSLPLKRPDAFSYGVLLKNFINGVLLFGPPGTGKTMLAKAVAKESGARVLEVKGSEVYDMYVGEGEKNVKAIFSLARKLSPCVVFLDEVDTIFSSRNASERHVSHREIINQFMAEWDGINALNSGVLILGATNRPFDLDDAILRRMPRRILVDLPTEEDRFAILNLLLADEALDSTVDLRQLAERTNLYSGSDLKNVCVSAAVTAVTEETASAAILDGEQIINQKTDNSQTQDSPKRVLKPAHFDKALIEVTPSISESMETIELLRKFDKQYGNAKDKKKKLMGFGTEPGEANANVRVVNP